MEGNYFARYRSTPQPTLTVREKEAGITQSGASAASSAASAEQTRAKMRQEELANKRRRATPEEVKAQGLDPNVSYQIDGLGRFILNPGQPPAKARVVDPSRLKSLQSTLAELKKSEDMAREGFLTVGRPAEIITNLPVIGGLLDQPRVDFEAANESIKARLMQDSIAKLALINQGGVGGMANTPVEAARMAAAIANLDPNQSREQFLLQAQRVRNYISDEMAQLTDKYSGAPTGPSAPQGDSDLVALVMAEKARRARERALKGQK